MFTGIGCATCASHFYKWRVYDQWVIAHESSIASGSNGRLGRPIEIALRIHDIGPGNPPQPTHCRQRTDNTAPSVNHRESDHEYWFLTNPRGGGGKGGSLPHISGESARACCAGQSGQLRRKAGLQAGSQRAKSYLPHAWLTRFTAGD